MTERKQLYIGGQWVQPNGTGVLEVTNSSTGEVVATIPEGSADDADRAVAAAAAAFDAWAARSVDDRAAVLERLAAGMQARADELARTVATEVGMPLAMAKLIQVGMPTAVMASFATIAREFGFEEL